ncbi:MAG: hypothetical protein IPK64_18075 [bacterium]|nr:hypothetical protein [bacterium]
MDTMDPSRSDDMVTLIRRLEAAIGTADTVSVGRITRRLIADGVDEVTAEKLYWLVPIAFGRVAMSGLGISFTDDAILQDDDGKNEMRISLAKQPIFCAALQYAQDGLWPAPGPRMRICAISPEIVALDKAFNAGVRKEDLAGSRFPALIIWGVRTRQW